MLIYLKVEEIIVREAEVLYLENKFKKKAVQFHF